MIVVGKKVLIRPISEDEITPAGIIVELASKKIPNKGIVVSVGKHCKQVREGDKVCFSTTGSTKALDHEGEEYFYVNDERDLLYIEREDRVDPISDWVVLEQAKGDEKTKSGILIPEEFRDHKGKAVVKYAGPLCNSVVEGNKIFYPERFGRPIIIQGFTYQIVREGEIMAIL